MRLLSRERQIEVWDNRVLKIDVRTIGLKGSPTWVSRIFSPQRDMGELIGDGATDPAGAAKLLVEKLLSKDLISL
jgi:electron transfer flavoprotein beta subunit